MLESGGREVSVWGVWGEGGGGRRGGVGLENRGWKNKGDAGGGKGKGGLTEIIQPEAVGPGVD